MSSIGNVLRMTIFGESHGQGLGVTLDALPAGEPIDIDAVLVQMARRAPGDGAYGTLRREPDTPEILSGLYNGKTTGAPLCAVIRNTNDRSADYENLRTVPRPGHADYTAQIRYGGAADMRGGGHFSGRLTAPLVFAGALCRQILARRGILIGAHVAALGSVSDTPFDTVSADPEQLQVLSVTAFPVISEDAKVSMLSAMQQARANGDSLGGMVECKVTGLPAGIGGPLFEGLEGRLSFALFGIPAVKGVEFGDGFACAALHGSENNDSFAVKDGRVVTATNHSGGILGGISNGMPLILRAALKPTPSIAQPQQSVDLAVMQPELLQIKGRHDPCVVPRAVPCVEAAVAVVLTDMMMERGML